MPNTNFVDLIKEISENARKAAKPSCFYVCDVVNDSPIEIRLNDMIVLDEDFLSFTETVKNGLSKNDKVLVLRNEGGQEFVVIDKVVK